MRDTSHPAARPTAFARALAATALSATLIVGVAGCSGSAGSDSADSSTPASVPASSSAASAPSSDIPGSTATEPSPGATLPPLDLPAESPALLDGFVVTVVAADDALSARGTAAVTEFAERNGADVTTLISPAGDDDTFGDNLSVAASTGRGVVVTVGPTATDLVDNVSASNLGQLFLLVGAQLPEPTSNVTAAVWPGADSRGTQALSAAALDAFAAHVDDGVRTGFAALLADQTGYVFALPVG